MRIPTASCSRIALLEAASGEDEFSYWVSLSLENGEGSLDTLSIVCGKEAQSCPGFEGLYFERMDQGSGEYSLANRIVANGSGILFEFNRRGREILQFDKTVCSWRPYLGRSGVRSSTH